MRRARQIFSVAASTGWQIGNRWDPSVLDSRHIGCRPTMACSQRRMNKTLKTTIRRLVRLTEGNVLRSVFQPVWYCVQRSTQMVGILRTNWSLQIRNRDEWKSANNWRWGKGTGDTDNSQEEGIDRFDEENRLIRPMLLTTRRPSEFWNIIKVRVQKNNICNLTGCRDLLQPLRWSNCFTKSKDIIDSSPVIAVVRPAAFKVWMSSFSEETRPKIAVSSAWSTNWSSVILEQST